MGLCTRYDARRKPSAACRDSLCGRTWLPVCPEQLGGLPTPRAAADLVGGDGYDVLQARARVIAGDRDVTPFFIRGARQCLAIARAQGIRTAILKSRSPSCGMGPPTGVTAALLLMHGISITEMR